jgi:hypothetical protein
MAKNLNAMRNGARITAYRLRLGEMSAPLRKQTTFARKYRRDLEAAVAEGKGKVDLLDAHAIDTAAAAEVHAAICRWLLRTRLEKMKESDIIACSSAIMKAKEVRDRAVARLGIGVPSVSDAIDALYAPTDATAAQGAPHTQDPGSDATAGHDGADVTAVRARSVSSF